MSIRGFTVASPEWLRLPSTLRPSSFLVGFLLSVVASLFVSAHTASTAFLQIGRSNDVVTLQLELPLRDLDDLLGLDANDDGQLSWGELKARQADIRSYLIPRFGLAAGGQPLPLQLIRHLASQRNGEGYAVLQFTAPAPPSRLPLDVSYHALFDRDPLHRCLVAAELSGSPTATDAGKSTAVFSPDHPTAAFSLERRAPTRLTLFVREGVHHIWTGYDHLLFLLALLLPAVLRRTDHGWEPARSFRAALTDVLKVVTAFTLAHSLTLALAAFEVIRLPSRLVESTIAASIIVAAVANLWPASRRSEPTGVEPSGSRMRWFVPWKVAFLFGLIHGFGFAGVLGELGLQRSQLAAPLFGFNAGVELGQLACVAVFLPLAFLLRATRFYRGAALPFGSLVIIALAGGWFVERAFKLGFMPI